MSSSVSWKKSKRLDPNTVSPNGMPYIIFRVSTTWRMLGILGEEPPQSIHVLSRWLQRLHINQTEDNMIPMSGTVWVDSRSVWLIHSTDSSEPDGIPVVEEEGRLKPRCRGGFRPIPCSDFIDWIPTMGLEDLVIKKITLWRSRDPPWHHEFVVVMFHPDDKYTCPNDILFPNLSERVPIQMLVATGLILRIDRGRRSSLPFGSRQIAVDVVEIMNPDADLGNCTEFWSVRTNSTSLNVEFFPAMRDLAYFLKKTMAKLGEDYHLLRRNCWSFSARLISLMSFYFLRSWCFSRNPPEAIWARQKFGGFDGFGSIIRHWSGDSMDLLDTMPWDPPNTYSSDHRTNIFEQTASKSLPWPHWFTQRLTEEIFVKFGEIFHFCMDGISFPSSCGGFGGSWRFFDRHYL